MDAEAHLAFAGVSGLECSALAMSQARAPARHVDRVDASIASGRLDVWTPGRLDIRTSGDPDY